jgi:hypothetical protein
VLYCIYTEIGARINRAGRYFTRVRDDSVSMGVSPGAVSRSSSASQANAWESDSPHISRDGRNAAQTAGYSGVEWIRQRRSSSRLTHLSPAGFPRGMPGIGELMEMAMQQAAHPCLHEASSVVLIGRI